MGVIIGFAVGYVLGTRAGQEGYEELRTTLKSITSSSEIRDLLTGGFSVLADVVKSGATTLAERSETEGRSVRRVA
ncbi:MAG: hypothetical protein ACRD12_19695 [Acidimicrobiales bacterium]